MGDPCAKEADCASAVSAKCAGMAHDHTQSVEDRHCVDKNTCGTTTTVDHVEYKVVCESFNGASCQKDDDCSSPDILDQKCAVLSTDSH